MARPPLPKIPAFARVLAIVVGLLHALPHLGAPASQAALLAAARAESGSLGPVSVVDRFYGVAWSLGGTGGLSVAETLLTFLYWIVVAFFLLAVAALIPWRRKLLLGLASLLLLASCWIPVRQWFVTDRATLALPLSAPVEEAAIARNKPVGSVFANSSALPFLSLFAPGAVHSMTPGQAADLTADPRLWRQEMRKSKWQTTVLSGPTTEIRPLLDHLLSSPDWALVKISNQGYVFERIGEAPPLPAFQPTSINLTFSSATAVYLAQIAERYDAIRRSSEAQAAMERALEFAPKNPVVLSHAASLEASHRRWQKALAYCDQTLTLDPGNTFAGLLKAVCLLETNQPDQAEQVARKVLSRAPNDPYTLFFYARICRTIHDYTTEAETLEKLVRVTKASGGGRILATYYVYLGQAYARMGRPNEAIANYRLALAEPSLDPEFAREVRASIQTIEDKRPK